MYMTVSSGFTAGSNTITAQYNGDENDQASKASASLTLAQSSTTTFLSSAQTQATMGSTAALTVVVNPSDATGTVSLSVGGIPAGAVTLKGGTATLNLHVTQANGFVLGPNTITANYAGSANFAASSGSTALQVYAASTISLKASPSTLVVNGGTTFIATVNPSTATGWVEFYYGNGSISGYSQDYGFGYIQNGVATLPVGATSTEFAIGTNAISAQYQGDSTYGTSSAKATFTLLPQSAIASVAVTGLTLTVNGSDFAADSVVLWNGQVRATSYVGETELTATLLASDLGHEQTALVTVAGNTPSPATSAAWPFAVQTNAPVAEVSSASVSTPPSYLNGQSLMTLTGTNFTPASVVELHGTKLAATYLSPWMLTAIITTQDYAGEAIVVVNTAGNSAEFLAP
jgi:hypothetical protein